MLKIANFNQLIPALELNESVRPLLIGIDGRPCSGKSTLADMLIEELSAEGLFLDDFFIPQKDWPNHISPAFPFPYFRYEEFSQGVRNLFSGHVFEYQPYDWTTSKLGEPKIINPKNIIIVEGVSVLSVELEPYFYKKIFVMSNTSNEIQAIQQRENNNIKIWKELYLPSVNIYSQTNPHKRADILYMGRDFIDVV